MAEILHQRIDSLSCYFQGFIHPRWCRISAINSMISIKVGWERLFPFFPSEPYHDFTFSFREFQPENSTGETSVGICQQKSTFFWHFFQKANMAGLKITIFNRRYIFKWLFFPIVMLVSGGVKRYIYEMVPQHFRTLSSGKFMN